MTEQLDQKGHLLPVLPLKSIVALPKGIIPVKVGRDISIKAVEKALRGDRNLFVVAQKSGDTVVPDLSDLFEYGTRAVILQMKRDKEGTMKLLVEGICRSKIINEAAATDHLNVYAQDIVSIPVEDPIESKALSRRLFVTFKEYVDLNERVSKDILEPLKSVEELEVLIDSMAVHVHINFTAKQALLEMASVQERAIRLAVMLENEIEVFKAEKSVRKRVQKQIEKHQRDYYLNEQIRAIHRELGKEDAAQEFERLRKAAKQQKLSKEATDKVNSECKRLEQMPASSPEASVSRNYIDWLLSLPWHKKTKDRLSLSAAEKILNKSHTGMKKVKERIIEFLAAKKFAGEKLGRSPIICLAGSPGVGKTSLARSIADALGRTFIRISLGGVRDESEIRGHRRTYIGSMPGKIIQTMKKAGVVNPVILLDEIDKMSADLRGDPSSALLEVLDPEQNKNFVDHFLEVGYDISKVLFIATANMPENIPFPLLDRMDTIYLSGYTEEEKVDIGADHLIPKLTKDYNLNKGQISFVDGALVKIISEYTKEAGVRQLERVLAKLFRKSIQDILGDKSIKKVVIDAKAIEKWLGAPKFKHHKVATEDLCGVATGLAWTEVGGDVLEVEITFFKGKGALTITGQLGEVMQESAQTALSYVRSIVSKMHIKTDFYANSDIHIHVPEGAVPKDGPSAGITLVVALASVLTKTPIRRDVAMTGEVTLRGRVLPVGGLREKLLAARRFGIKTVIVPADNRNDIKEFESELKGQPEIVYAEHVDEVLKVALVKSPFEKKVVAKKKAPAKKKSAAKS